MYSWEILLLFSWDFVVQSLTHVWLCHAMDCSMPAFPVLHHLPEFAQTHVHWVSDAIQPSHPLSSSSPPAFSLSQHEGLFLWVSSSHQVAKGLELQLQHQSLQWIFNECSWALAFLKWKLHFTVNPKVVWVFLLC